MLSSSSSSLLLLLVLLSANPSVSSLGVVHGPHFGHEEPKLFQDFKFNILALLKSFQHLLSTLVKSLFFFLPSFLCIFTSNSVFSGRSILNPETRLHISAMIPTAGYPNKSWWWMSLIPVQKTGSCRGKINVCPLLHYFSQLLANIRSSINIW